jgi:hypothetical protein
MTERPSHPSPQPILRVIGGDPGSPSPHPLITLLGHPSSSQTLAPPAPTRHNPDTLRGGCIYCSSLMQLSDELGAGAR